MTDQPEPLPMTPETRQQNDTCACGHSLYEQHTRSLHCHGCDGDCPYVRPWPGYESRPTFQAAVAEPLPTVPAPTPCPSCYGYGEWENECCSGAGGCSCQGQMVSMGTCRVCQGSGLVDETSNLLANVDWIYSTGAGFLGTGPRTGSIFDGMPRLGIRR